MKKKLIILPNIISHLDDGYKPLQAKEGDGIQIGYFTYILFTKKGLSIFNVGFLGGVWYMLKYGQGYPIEIIIRAKMEIKRTKGVDIGYDFTKVR